MRTIHRFSVVATLPERLLPLAEIGRNLWWSWNPEAIELFRRIDPDTWAAVRQNPVTLLREVSQERLVRLMANEAFLAHMDRVHGELKRYLEHSTWYAWVHGAEVQNQLAYFSLEFGIHECLPIYSGGLGVLAGDHLKSASELGLPLTGVGILYRNGYFRQTLSPDGWQQESYQRLNFDCLPVTLVTRDNGEPVVVKVDFPGRYVTAQIWRVDVGRIRLYLLDCDHEGNTAEDREITSQLYGGDLDMRIRQEMVLGIGGMRALRELGLNPSVCHMNEGHSAFLALERIRHLMAQHQLSFDAAREIVTASNVFTTHTPVPAGNDVFPKDLVRRYFEQYAPTLGLTVDDILGFGRVRPEDRHADFTMPVLAMRLSAYANGVSKLHGKVTRNMWSALWPELTEAEIPISHITNGIHTRSWLSDEFARLYDRYLGPSWLEDPMDVALWERVDTIPDAEMWRAKERLRERLVAFARGRLRSQLERRGLHGMRVQEADHVLDPEALTIGFARRFASYKRALLILQDPDRLATLLNNPKRPVQLIFAGKAHPRDKQGKELIRQLVLLAQREDLRRRLVFLEDYDTQVARYLVQGADIWLNTPRRPLEASGTSGMKAPVNGGINLSVMDGWWVEGYDGENGWAIGRGEEFDDGTYQDEVESRALLGLLEQEVVPLFYHRGSDSLPRDWITMMRASIRTVCPVFNTNRMVREYLERYYLPAAMQYHHLAADEAREAKELVQWREVVERAWQGVRITDVNATSGLQAPVGGDLAVDVKVQLGQLSPKDVTVELFFGPLDGADRLTDGQVVVMSHRAEIESGEHLFAGQIPCTASGSHGYAVRVLPWRSVLGRMIHSGPIAVS
jgi:starch phosphorylase